MNGELMKKENQLPQFIQHKLVVTFVLMESKMNIPDADQWSEMKNASEIYF